MNSLACGDSCRSGGAGARVALTLTWGLALCSAARLANAAAPPAPEVAAAAAMGQGMDQGMDQGMERAASWAALLERDRRASFSDRTAASAVRVLEAGSGGAEADPAARATALYALGASRAAGERGRIEAWIQEGPRELRGAAILALGELQSGDLTVLGKLATEADMELAGLAMLALLRSGRDSARRFVDGLALAGGERGELAAELMVFHVDRTASRETSPARRWLELRWDAARVHGLIDGEAWSVLSTRELAADESFLDALVYLGAAERSRDGLTDHLLHALLARGGEVCLRAAVRRLPEELGRLVEAGLWTPPDEAAWMIVLEEVERERSEARALRLLVEACDFEQLRWRAQVLRLRTGDLEAGLWLEGELAQAGAGARVELLDALASLHDSKFQPWIETLAQQDGAEVRAAAMVARLLTGVRGAETALEAALFGERAAGATDALPPAGTAAASAASAGSVADAPARAALVAALCRQVGEVEILPYLARISANSQEPERLRVAQALVSRGRAQGRELLREAVRADPTSNDSLWHLRALGSAPASEDLALVREMFPVSGARDLNLELALILLRQRDPLVVGLLRAALWRAPFQRSMLASLLMVELVGLDGLRAELFNVPPGARAADVRRVGFALGEWGGLDQLELLGERATGGDPALQGLLLGALGARTR
jgi:hypothetical protein